MWKPMAATRKSKAAPAEIISPSPRRKRRKSDNLPIPDSAESAAAIGLQYFSDTQPGIRRKRQGKGFIYIGIGGKQIHDEPTLRRIASVVIPPAWKDVWICPRNNGYLQATGRDARGRKQYRYHPKYRQTRDQTKYDRMLVFGKTLRSIRKTVAKDLSQSGLSRERILAAIVRLLDQTGIRIGNEEYARTNGSFGLTTLRNGHAQIHGDTIHLRFRGKSGVEKELDLRDPKLARIVKRCHDLPGKELFQYQTSDSEFHGISSGDVNEYLRTISGQDITAKDFRTWHGTRQMLVELAQVGPAASEADSKRRVAAAVKATALHLGNRPATCRKYYIHPAVFECYSTNTIPAIFGSADSEPAKQESALLKLMTTDPFCLRP
jgi:DNA topoisomerase I